LYLYINNSFIIHGFFLNFVRIMDIERRNPKQFGILYAYLSPLLLKRSEFFELYKICRDDVSSDSDY